jgi:phosphopantetheine adenylyltransferase
VERDGKWYCGTHDPVMVKARRDAQDAKWRAGMFDELVAALHQIARKMSAFSSESRAAQIKGAVAIAEQLLAKIDERKP